MVRPMRVHQRRIPQGCPQIVQVQRYAAGGQQERTLSCCQVLKTAAVEERNSVVRFPF